jgi:phosphoserine aminotransferase
MVFASQTRAEERDLPATNAVAAALAGDREVLNFYAGPTALPWPVVERIRHDLVDFQSTGMGVMEISHRAPEIEFLLADTAARARCLLGVSEDFEVLFVQGGGSLQFSMIPMNFSAPGDAVDYVDTGYWAQKAIAEPRRIGRDVAVISSSGDRSYSYVPAVSSVMPRPAARYLHVVTNNTVEGTQFRQLPQVGIPLIADMSSDLMSDLFDADACDLAYAHAQKNIGIAGVTLAVMRKSMLDRISAEPRGLPAILDYRTHAEHHSNYHTPPTFSIYVTWLMLGWLEEEIGGLAAMGAINRRKAAALYGYLDETPFYRCLAERDSRSAMNVTFTLPSEQLLGRFLDEAGKAGIVGLGGHRSMGGCRASLFNGVTQDMVDRLVDFMHAFERRNRLGQRRRQGAFR